MPSSACKKTLHAHAGADAIQVAVAALHRDLGSLAGFSRFFNDTATTEIYTLSLHDALPICNRHRHAVGGRRLNVQRPQSVGRGRSEEHTSELQSLRHLVCRLLLEKKKQ